MKLSFEKALVGFFLFIITAVILLGIGNYNNNKAYYESSQWVDRTNDVLKESSKTLSTLQDMVVRGYLTTGDSVLLDSYITANRNLPNHLSHLRELLKDNEEQTRRLDTLSMLAAQRQGLIQKYLAIYSDHKLGKEALSDFTIRGKLNMDHIHEMVSKIDNAEEALLKSRKIKTAKDKHDFDLSLFLVFAVITLLLAACLITVSHYINSIKKSERDILALNTELKKNIEELHNVNKELESFSYSVSHDLRAPLRIIDGFAKIISEEYTDKLDHEGKRFLETIRSNTKQMGLLIDDLLNFSRIGRRELALTTINMSAIVEHVVESFKILDNNQHADIQVQPLKNCKCDEHLIQQVWINLISNALKYSRSESNPVIIIGSQENDTEIIYYIKDNGVGFDMEFVGKLFGVFQRLHKASEYEGTGVGLALVNRIISKHKGRVWADAKVDEGATFYFSIPK